jgi:serine/threonine protein phosphatase PrpC
MMVFAFTTDAGQNQEKNEDAFGYVDEELFLVADGLGGLPAGEVAAQAAVEKAIETYEETKNLKRAFELANHEVYRQSREKAAYFGMATTLVGVVIEDRKATFANVGDSRAYLLQGDFFNQITLDHGLGGGIVTRVLGIKPEVKIDLFKAELKPGDLILLCTDGFYQSLSDEEILKILAKTGKTKKALKIKAKELVKAANQAGGLDDVTVCLVKLV